MNSRGWTNERVAQGQWRAPAAQPAAPSNHHPFRPPVASQEHRLQQHAAFLHRQHHPVNAIGRPTPQEPAPAAQPSRSGSPTATAQSWRQPEGAPASGAHAAPFRPDSASNPTGLWWLQSGAKPYGDARISSPVTENLSAFEGQLRHLTQQIEGLRYQSAAPGGARAQVQQSLDEIVAPLMRAVPVRAIESLENGVLTLVARIDASRKSGVEPHLLAPIEHGLNEVRAVLQRLQPQENLAAFQGALHDLTERLSKGRDAQHVSAQPQIDAAITALRNIAGLIASTENLTALADEVRGLTARCQRIVAPGGSRPVNPGPAQLSAEALPLSIERSLSDINLRLDALLKDNSAVASHVPEAGLSDNERSAQEALEAAHATLSELAGLLERKLKAPREFRAASPGLPPAIDRLSLSGGTPCSREKLGDLADEYELDFPQAGRHRHAAYADMADDIEPETQRRSIVIPARPLMFGVLVIVLAVAASRISMQLTDLPLPAVTKADAFQAAGASDTAIRAEIVEPNVPDLVRSQAPETVPAAPERPAQQSALATNEPDHTGVIGRPVPVAAGSHESTREPSQPLPDSLPVQLRAEAAKGKAAAEFEVGVRLVEGKSAPVNTEEGLRWLRRAAKSGIIPAHLWIGSLYEKGQGVEKDLTQARTHYLAAAEKGNAKAMHNLAVLYAEGIDGRRDYKTASRWFQRAAERGIADSQYNLAVLLMRGIGVDQNHQDAYKWFALAALQGDREAARHRDEISRKLEPSLLTKANSAVQAFVPQTQPNEAVVVATPPGGWDRSTSESGAGRKSRSGIFARGAS